VWISSWASSTRAGSEHGWWQGCDELGAPGVDPFGPYSTNFNRLIGATARDPVSGTASHRSYLCEIRPVDGGKAVGLPEATDP
jgi:hypothetical protein